MISFPSPGDLIKSFELGISLKVLVQSVLLGGLGYLTARITSTLVSKALAKHITAHHCMVFRYIIFWIILIGFGFGIMMGPLQLDINRVGASFLVLLVGIGISAQSLVPNFISGIALMIEKPFAIGDNIVINEWLGEVLSIDLLSTKIRTRDNTLVRVPNEAVLKTELRNLSHFPIRRLDISMHFNFKEDLDHVKTILFDVAQHNPQCLDFPIPEAIFLGFGEYGAHIQLSIWCKQNIFFDFKDEFQFALHKALNANGIKIATLYLPNI